MTVKDLVVAERRRLREFGLTKRAVDNFWQGQLSGLAICYALSEEDRGIEVCMSSGLKRHLDEYLRIHNPLDFEPSDEHGVEDLVKAIALLELEVDRLLRLKKKMEEVTE
jgi:hypothetical protein